MSINLNNLTIKKAHEAMKNGEFTAVDLTQAYLDEIKKQNVDVNAYLEVFDGSKESKSNSAIESAKIADQMFKDGTASILTGIPCGIKDNILIKGNIVSASSKYLENYHATYDATVISKLKEAGVVFLGRTNMDEFAMGGSTENSAYGVTKNPHDLNRVAGGSSGGSSAAVAMNGALFTLGSDTGGSIRQPASFCGVVGLKPTYGAVSRYGLMAMGSSLDQIGPLAKTVEDCEIVFNAIKGKDPMDGTTLESQSQQKKSNAKIIGVPRDIIAGDGIDKSVLDAFENSLNEFKKKGYEIKDISLPNASYAIMVYYIVMPAEVSANMSRYDGVRFGLHVNGKDGIDDYFESRRAGFGKEVIRRILLGTYVLSSGYYDAYYNRANAVRRMIREDFEKAFLTVDIIATPTAPSPAFKIGEKSDDPMSMYLEDIFTVTANLTGMPAISIPCGNSNVSGQNLPIGLQLTAPHGEEEKLFAVSKDLSDFV